MNFGVQATKSAKVKRHVIMQEHVQRPPVLYEYLTQAEIYSGSSDTFVFDIECYSNYFCIKFYCCRKKKFISIELTQDEKSFDLVQYLLKTSTLIGFNSINYDMLMLSYWLTGVDNAELKLLSNFIINNGKEGTKIWNSDIEKKFKFKILRPKQHIDLMEVCPLQGGMKTYSARLHGQRLQELPFHHARTLTANEQAIVGNYCENDCIETYRIFIELKEQLKLRKDLSKQYHVDLMSKSDAQIAEAIIVKEIAKELGYVPAKPQIEQGRVYKYKVPDYIKFTSSDLQKALAVIESANYFIDGKGRVVLPPTVKALTLKIGTTNYAIGIGGLHSQEKKQSFVAKENIRLIDEDVESYYPRIILNLKLFPERLGEAFLKVYNILVERRITAKTNAAKCFKRGDAVAGAMWQAQADGLKIVINGSFGKFGSPWSRLYGPDLLIQVTITGQLSLLMLAEAKQAEGIQVISANTDGLVSVVPKSKEPIFYAITDEWRNKTNFKTEETEYSAVYSRDVNNYIAVKPDGKIKFKGAFSNPWEGGAKDAIFRFHKNPKTTICIEAVSKFLYNKTSIEKTIKDCTDIKKFISVVTAKKGAHKNGEYLGKILRWYYAKNETGCIKTMEANNKVPETDGARPVMDLPSHIPDDIDYEWYISKSYKILEDIGYGNNNSTLF